MTATVPRRMPSPRPRLLEPGLRRLPPGTERYRVCGGGLSVFSLAVGDSVEIVDPEGRQRCELAVFDQAGRTDPAAIGATASGAGAGIDAILAGSGDAAGHVSAILEQHGIRFASAPVVTLFDGDSAPGERVSFTAQRAALCIVAAPGRPMRVDAHDPPTDLSAVVHRARVPDPVEPPLPTPLADPRADFRVGACTARAYRVKAGEFIQIIDVAGRQCSDFQAFTVSALDAGRERCLDATATRSLTGGAYPRPGLYAKFFDRDMQPLMTVVRDTVGRHDTFNLACTAKYYEDLGYPGHANCTDNINRELEPFGVGARRSWEAINFFYNTNLDATNQIYLDEPWSRPGDYVLLRAQIDLVCVSTACPCDVDAANGWDPTDIHVRVYPGTNNFSRAIAYRMTTDSDTELTKETAFHPRTSRLTRDFTEYRGYWLANSYTQHGAINEYWACRERAAIMDLSPLRKFEVVGPDAEALLQWCVTRNMRRLAIGQVVYTAMCYDTGGMLDDGTVFRLGADNFRWIGGSDYSGIWLREQAAERGLRAWVKSSTEQLHNIAVQGPESRVIVEDVVWTPPAQPSIEELGWFRFTIGRIGDFDGVPIIASRTGYSGELGYEIWCHPKDASAVWDAVWEAGQAHDIAPLGLQALDMLRIESGLIFAGYEFDDQTDPFEAGIGFTVPLKSKEDDFVGRAALQERKTNPQRKLVGLELEGEEAGANGDGIYIGRQQVGIITSATRSPILRKNIALCRMAVAHAALGTEVEVGKLDGHQKRIPARVVRFPFYDPDKARVRM